MAAIGLPLTVEVSVMVLTRFAFGVLVLKQLESSPLMSSLVPPPIQTSGSTQQRLQN
jgi:hypothetical protein